ncbi:MAG: magnesium chelatase subunit D [Alphaproteobacteria bacterium]|nr:magnesium chelatase subunit D [Alphaproteobacteria bacterium]
MTARSPDKQTGSGPGSGDAVSAVGDPQDVLLSAVLLAIDSLALGGAWVRARPGPVLDRWLSVFRECLPPETPVRRLPVHVGDDRLIGGLDLAATLRSGRPQVERGLLAQIDGGVLVAPMAERMTAGTASRLSSVLDTGIVAAEREGISARWPARVAVVALDEGRDDDEAVPAMLLQRLALAVDLAGVSIADLNRIADEGDLAAMAQAARLRLRDVAVGDDAVEALCAIGAALGVPSLGLAGLAVRVARAHAALAGRAEVADQDVSVAVGLVYAQRATQLPGDPADPPDSEPDPPQPDPPQDDAQKPDDATERTEPETAADRLIEAALAALPPNLLEQLAASAARQRSGANTGRRGEGGLSRRRGRPVGSVPGDPRRGDRLNLADTLRTAAPWQRLRGRDGDRVLVRPEDFRVARYRHRTESVTVFVVDASGSAALNRLAEAKGAVELLLAECYVRRDRVALLGFRGTAAELLLPPTRSLVRAKRSLAGLPGGGGTPLASGLDMAAAMALAIRREERTPSLVVLTDGRANVNRDGEGGRAQAMEDALDAARRIAGAGVSALVLDTSPRPRPEAAEIAGAMRATYLPLPQADAATVSRAVIAARGDGARRQG